MAQKNTGNKGRKPSQGGRKPNGNLPIKTPAWLSVFYILLFGGLLYMMFASGGTASPVKKEWI